MGTTLENGVYLPSEGERNCYAGLKTNWEILDQKVADVTALQQAVAGALHREIVESLPTTDIDPNTIYMVLSGTSATENVYNEFMYVNNAWELIGTSATDLTNYYTKAEVDGKLLLKANASDLTSHTGDTTIHVTTADKNKWNTVTSKANDSDVVHKSGDETVGGVKTFSDIPVFATFDGIRFRCAHNSSAYITFRNANQANPGSIILSAHDGSVSTPTAIHIVDKTLTPYITNDVSLGTALRKWKEIHAMEYYYGSGDSEFSSKFVTSDTAQTITERKTFTKNVTIKNEDVTIGSTSGAGSKDLTFTDSADNALAKITANKVSNGSSSIAFRVDTTDSNDANINSQFQFFIAKSGVKVINPTPDNDISLGRTSNRWKDTCTCLINGLEPSSLSLPSDNLNDIIDISSYLSVLDGSNANTYVAPANGWISITMNNCSGMQAYITGFWGHQIVRPTAGVIRFLMPVLKNQTVNILIFGGTIDNARFIPCQGNV